MTLVIAWLLGLMQLVLPTAALAEGSKQLTPNTPGTPTTLTDPANTRAGYLEHDANLAGAAYGYISKGFLKPSGYTNNGKFTYADNQRLYVLLKPGETVYYGVHRIPHTLNPNNTSNASLLVQNNLIISARWSADGTGTGTVGKVSKILRDSSAANTSTTTRGAAFLTTLNGNPQAGVIADTTQNRVGPKVGGLPANGYAPLSYTNSTSSTQYVWFEFVQQGEYTNTGAYNTAFAEVQRFSTYDFWDFTVKDNAGVEKPGRLFSKQWAFSAGSTTNVFSATFNMYPLIPSPINVGRYYVKKFELAGIAPQNLFRFVSNSMGSTASTTDFTVSRKSQTLENDYPEYLNFVNNPDPTVWPSADDPDLKVVSTASYCKGTGGVMEFFLNSALGGTVNIIIDLNGTPGYQSGTKDVLITRTIPVGNSRVEWNGLDGTNAVVSSGTVVTLVFQNGTSPIAPVNFPVYDAENNVGGFRVQNVRPGRQGFDVLYWDDSNLSTTLFPDGTANPRVQSTGLPSNTGVHAWGSATATDATVNAGNNYLVNTYTYGQTGQQVLSYTFSYLCDPDGDGINDNVDIDQDNDGITNTAESGGVDPTTITANGVPRYLDAFEANFIDINGDGINDVYDLDLDGRPNFLDIDADGDGIPDTIEANNGLPPTGYDANLSRYPSTGVGANGMPDAAETAAESGVTKLPLTNTDNNGRPDYLDIDSDDDGIVDNIEAQTTAAYRAPSGSDSDGDGLDNTYDLTPGGSATAGTAVPLTDTDSDGLPDYRDLNSDNDARTDAVEGWDTNNDGVAETVASGIDADGDGLDDAFDKDPTRTNPTNGQTPTSFPDNNTSTPERAWREVLTPTSVATITITGRIFEDVNYSGGAGRDYTTANNSAVASGFTSAAINRPATVELYDANGAFVATTTATAVGGYTFTLSNKPAGSYTVRVVNSTVTTVRLANSGSSTTGLLSVQTYANGMTNKVGGEIPSKVDAPARSGTQTLADIIGGTTTTAQTLTTINVPATSTVVATVSGIDFGFNFDIISNTNPSGQGSLAQFITNSNALANTNLAQTGLTAGRETSIFMIGDGRTMGTPPTGLRSGVNGGFNTVTQTATITLTAALPSITDSNTALDGSRQTAVTGNNVAGDGENTTGPEVVVNFNSYKGLFVTGGNTRIASLGLNNAKGSVGVSSTPTYSDGAAVTFNGAGVTGSVATDITATGSASAGIRLQGSATGVTVSNNVLNGGITTTVGGTTQGDGLNLVGASDNTFTGNVLNDNKGWGILLATNANDNNTFTNNTIRRNGSGSGSSETVGIMVQVGNNNIFTANTITGSTGSGIAAYSGTSSNTFSQNSISGNGGSSGMGIDLMANNTSLTGAGSGVTLNADSKTATSGANGMLNFPVLMQAKINNNNLQLDGFAPSGAVVEIFIAAANSQGFGQGQTFLFSRTEGSSDDTNATTGSYSGQINGRDQGTCTNANRFLFTIPLSAAQVAALAGATLTSTATLANTTSEFSGNIVATTGPLPVVLTAFEASAVQASAKLTWTTASEISNDHFEVERSFDGTTFAQIGVVAGHGTTTVASAYSLTDAGVAAKASGPVYYRLRQVDLDGTATYSPVRSVSFPAAAGAPVALRLYPNPAQASTTLDLRELPTTGTYQVTLLDATGRTVRAATLSGGLVQPLDVHELATGTYLLRVSGQQPDGAALHQTLRFTKE